MVKRAGGLCREFLVFGTVFFCLLIVDLVIKYVSMGVVDVTFIPRFISFHYTQNRGVAFGWFYGAGLWLVFISLVLIVVGSAIYILHRHKRKQTHGRAPKLLDIAFAFFLAGAVGNFFDRVFYGYVRDFIRFDFMNFPIFNLADVFINVGVLLLIVYILFFEWRKKKEPGIAPVTVDTEEEDERND